VANQKFTGPEQGRIEHLRQNQQINITNLLQHERIVSAVIEPAEPQLVISAPELDCEGPIHRDFSSVQRPSSSDQLARPMENLTATYSLTD
jgi:hypothetical protein